jgi:hypothetical protein
MARKKATPKQNLYVGLGMLGLCGILALMGSGDDDDKTKTTKPTAAASQPAVIALTDIPATDIPITETSTTEAPTDMPAPVEPTTEPEQPTELPPPAEPTAEPAPPTEIPAPRPDLDPMSDINCSDFGGTGKMRGQSAQAWWEYWRTKGIANPGGLDGNNNGEVCE